VVWCGVVWCGVVWCGVVWCGVVWCGVVWCGVVWCGVVWLVWCVAHRDASEQDERELCAALRRAQTTHTLTSTMHWMYISLNALLSRCQSHGGHVALLTHW
jgi:hypothetical protein